MKGRPTHTFDEFLASMPTQGEEVANGIRLALKDGAVKVDSDRLVIDSP